MLSGFTAQSHLHHRAKCIFNQSLYCYLFFSPLSIRPVLLFRSIFLLLIMNIMLLGCPAVARPLNLDEPSSSRNVADINVTSIEEDDKFHFDEIDELRYNVRQLNSASRNDNVSRNTSSSEQIILLPHHKHSLQKQKQQQSAADSLTSNKTFLDESQRAFHRLSTRLDVEPPLLSDEERRRIWLQRPRRRKLILQERREQSLSQNRFVGLSSANFTNSTNHTCKGDLFKHKVRMAGCEPKIIINRFCHGSCASFYIPKLRARELRASFRSCAACVPSETDLVQITLDCPGRVEHEIVRTVMRVKRCACRNIEINDYDYMGADGDNVDD